MSKITNNIINYIRSYSRYDLKRESLAWLKIVKFYLPVAIPIAAAAIAVFIYIKPIPLTKTYLAIGQGGGMYEQMASTYQAYFVTQDLDLELVKTEGLESGLQQAHDDTSRVDSSFVTSGTATAKQYPGLVSLGSVEAAPLWLFYRGKPIHVDDPFEYFSQKSIAVGTEHTVTHRMFTTMMALSNPGTGERSNFLRLAHSDAANKLRKGEIDAMFIVDGFDSSLIQSLLDDPEIHLMDFTLADAYVRKLPYLQKVTIPKASINLSETIPSQEIALLATSVNLLVENTLHPAVQWAFLIAAQDRNLKTQRFFTNTGPYPAYQDKAFPLSPVAERFYKHGVPRFGGRDELSCALVFRYTTRTELFDALTGKKMNKCNDESYKQKFSESDRILHKYITSDDCKKDCDHLKLLYKKWNMNIKNNSILIVYKKVLVSIVNTIGYIIIITILLFQICKLF